MSFDTKCHALAESFLVGVYVGWTEAERKAVTDELAQTIQTAIEDYLEENGI